ncbi:MAG: Hsp20/alpha crystallin family protein [Anaerolineae bacterium]|nr:Hsp20/alpha crystallin family protein [Anaerolineae bacterium]
MTTMIRWNPVRDMMAMQNAVDRMFDDNWRAVRPSNGTYSLPLDVYENDASYVIVATLPGVGADNIQVNWHDDVLTISAELPQGAPEGENQRTHMIERAAGKVSRSLRLSRPINTEGVEAVYENGVLTLTLPKTPEAQPKMIPVRTTISAN